MSMEKIESLLKEFAEVSEHPHRQIKAFKAEGKKVIGILPYYAGLVARATQMDVRFAIEGDEVTVTAEPSAVTLDKTPDAGNSGSEAV